MPMHQLLRKEMRLEDAKRRFAATLSLSDMQNAYAHLFLNNPLLGNRLKKYFRDVQKETLKSDWKWVAQVTPKKQEHLSPKLKRVVETTLFLIKTVYGVEKPQRLGGIMRRILFLSSLNFKPTVNKLYLSLSEEE